MEIFDVNDPKTWTPPLLNFALHTHPRSENYIMLIKACAWSLVWAMNDIKRHIGPIPNEDKPIIADVFRSTIRSSDSTLSLDWLLKQYGWLRDYLQNSNHGMYELRLAAIEKDNVPILELLLGYGFGHGFVSTAAAAATASAAASGLDVVLDLFSHACALGCRNVAEFLHGKHTEETLLALQANQYELVKLSCMSGVPDLCRWILNILDIDVLGTPCELEIFKAACEGGDLELAKELYVKFKLTRAQLHNDNAFEALRIAFTNDKTEIVDWLNSL